MFLELFIIGAFCASVAAVSAEYSYNRRYYPTYYLTAVPFNASLRTPRPNPQGIYLPDTYIMTTEAYNEINSINTKQNINSAVPVPTYPENNNTNYTYATPVPISTGNNNTPPPLNKNLD